MRELLAQMKDMRVLDSEISIRSALTEADTEALAALADLLAAS
mgnify:FL=1